MAFGPRMRFKVGELQIELAPITKETVGEYVAGPGGLQHHSIQRYLAMTWAPTAEDELDWYEKTRATKDNLCWGIWVINGDSRELIGNTVLEHITKWPTRQAVSGSLIFKKEYWGKGIASAAHKARTWYGFNQLGLIRIKSAVIQGNSGSRKALERSGYNLVYVERNETFIDGTLHHLDNLECLNPAPAAWRQWWHGDRPTTAAIQARIRTREALAWAEENVELL